MEKKNRKTLILSVIICLLPIVLGLVLYHKLPEQMPIHFTIQDVPDNYAPKNFALFGIPLIMAIVQAICLIAVNIKWNQLKTEAKPKILKIMEWFIPIVIVLLYVIMVEVALGSSVYVGKSICFILGVLFMIIGNYIPKMSYEMGKTTFHPMPKSEKSFRRMSKIMGYLFMITGIILLIIMLWV